MTRNFLTQPQIDWLLEHGYKDAIVPEDVKEQWEEMFRWMNLLAFVLYVFSGELFLWYVEASAEKYYPELDYVFRL